MTRKYILSLFDQEANHVKDIFSDYLPSRVAIQPETPLGYRSFMDSELDRKRKSCRYFSTDKEVIDDGDHLIAVYNEE